MAKEKLWAGRTDGQSDSLADDFNTSLPTDCRMYAQDIRGSLAHAAMLASQGIISTEDARRITEGLASILDDLKSGALDFSAGGEDIHMFIESELTARIGDAGKRLHTARSRNDQVALDIRLYLRDEAMEIIELLRTLITTLTDRAEEHKTTILPGYTHLQRAQPITFGHHLMAYAMMLMRDVERILDATVRMNYSPLGSAALAGTTYPIDRFKVAKDLGFDGITMNSLDGVSDRDFCLELNAAFAICMMHLSRMSEELIMWTSWEFRFIEMDDAYTTGSSIMPQKKNPDMAELIRGKTGRVYGNLVTLLTMLKGLPLAYNKDMQEDKEAIFDSVVTVKRCLSIMEPLLRTMRVREDNMRAAAAGGFINATDCADYLVTKGMPFRSAYKIVGSLVSYCIEHKTTLEALSLDVYRQFAPEFDEGVYDAVSLDACAMRRVSAGGTGKESVEAEIAYVRAFLADK